MKTEPRPGGHRYLYESRGAYRISTPIDSSSTVSRSELAGGNGSPTICVSYLDERDGVWIRSVSAKLNRLLALPFGWDSYKALPVSRDSAIALLKILSRVMRPGTPIPTIVPAADGSVQCEWHTNGIDLEVRPNVASGYSLYCSNTRTGQELDISGDEDDRQLLTCLARLSS